MHDACASKCDLHVHSKYSDRPSEWFLRRIGTPESFVEPRDVYRNARQRGMDFVTISDHNCIRGALEIADLPGSFLSNEVTTYFPENGCKVHVLVSGISEEQFRMIQELRADIYQLHEYLVGENILSSVSHPLFRVNGRLTIDQFERADPAVPAIRGDQRLARPPRGRSRESRPWQLDARNDRRNGRPARHRAFGPEPWKKTFTGGSDDHSGAYIGLGLHDDAVGRERRRVPGFLGAGSRAGWRLRRQRADGARLYHIAYDYYKDRFLRGNATASRRSSASSLIGSCGPRRIVPLRRLPPGA